MPDSRRSPTLRRRRLSAILRELRARDGRTAKEVAAVLEWPASKLTHMERNEWKLPRVHDIRALLDVYGVSGERERDELFRLARDGRQRGWWHAYREMLSESYSTYIGLESEAETLLIYQPLVIPGLLQTDDYARALIQAGPAEVDSAGVEQRVDVRRERQAILAADHPVRVWAVIDEAALRRSGGGPEIMRKQLQHVAGMARSARVTVQMIPFTAGLHAGVTGGSFTILQFPDAADQDAVYVDTFAGELFVEELEEVGRFHLAFRHLVGAALSPMDTLAAISAEAAGA